MQHIFCTPIGVTASPRYPGRTHQMSHPTKRTLHSTPPQFVSPRRYIDETFGSE